MDFLLAYDFLKDEHCVSSTTVFPAPVGPKKRTGLYRSAKQTKHRGKERKCPKCAYGTMLRIHRETQVLSFPPMQWEVTDKEGGFQRR